jgi:VWFA-related protein
MKKLIPVLLLLLLLFVIQIPAPVTPQTRQRTVVVTRADGDIKVADIKAEVVKVDVDLVTVDALVLQKKTARVVGDLRLEDFVLSEDGIKQTITHFGQDSLPLSVLLLIDRGGCLDPFGSEVRYAARAALSRLKPSDEVAVMTYHDTVELLQEFTHNHMKIEDALNRVPPHDEHANHCLNRAFYEAANYMVQSGNPEGRRVAIVITGVKRNFDCPNGPSGKAAMQAVFESGSVVCGIIPKTAEQAIENGMMRWATRIGGLARVSSLNIDKLAEETGGEVLEDKPENLDRTFNTLINDLRSRYSLAFVSSNKNRDGTLRKLKIDLAPSAPKSHGKLVVKARRSYIAPKSRS